MIFSNKHTDKQRYGHKTQCKHLCLDSVKIKEQRTDQGRRRGRTEEMWTPSSWDYNVLLMGQDSHITHTDKAGPENYLEEQLPRVGG